MEREDHINKLRNKLNSQSVIKDMDALWDELEPRLPKQKKNRKFMIWLPLVGLLFIAILLGVLHINEKEPVTTSKLAPANTATAEILNKDATTKNNKNEEQKETNPTSSTSVNTTPTNTSQPNQNSIVSLEKQEVERSNDLLIDVAKDYKTPLNNKPTITQTSTNQLIDKKDSSINKNKISKSNEIENKNPIILTKIPVKELIEKSEKKPASERTTTQKPTEQNQLIKDATSKPFLFPTLQKLGIDKMYTSIDDIRIPNYALIDKVIDREHKWLVSFNSYAMGEWNFKSQTNLTDYGSDLDNLTSIMPGYSFGGQFSLRSTTGLFFGLGIEQSRIFEKFKVDNSVISSELAINEEAFLFKGQFIANEQEVTTTTNQSVLTYNDYTKTNLTPFIGYTISRNLNYEIAVSPIFNIKHDYAGYLIDENQLITSDLENLYNYDGIGLAGYTVSTNISKQFSNKFNLGLRTQFRNLSKNVSDNNSDFSIELKSVSLGLNLGYTFN